MLLWPQTWTLFFKISMKRRETGVPGGKPSSRNIVFNFVRFAILKCSTFKYKIQPQSLSKPFKRIAGLCFTQVFTESPATLYFSCLQLNIHRVRFGCGVHFPYMSIGPKEVRLKEAPSHNHTQLPPTNN